MTDILCERFQVTLDRKIKGYSKGMKQKIGMVHYFDPGKNLILHKTEWSHLTVLLAVAVIFLAAAVVWLNKRDIAVT